MILSVLPTYAVADLKMGVFPRRSALITKKSFTPFARHLSQKLGEKVELVISKDFPTFLKHLENKTFDLVHCTQYHYIKAHKESGYRIIAASEEFGMRMLSGALLVRKDSGIEKLTDLKGKTIMFGGDKAAMGAFLAPKVILKKKGLKEGSDYTAKYAKSGPNAVVTTFRKVSDAAGAGDIVMKLKTAATKRTDMTQMKILAETEPFVHLPWAVKEDMSEDKTGKIKEIMFSLKNNPAGKKVLKATGSITDFYKVTDADFDVIREMTKFVLGEEY